MAELLAKNLRKVNKEILFFNLMDTTKIKMNSVNAMNKWRIIRLISELGEIEGLEVRHSGNLEAELGNVGNILEIKPITGHEIHGVYFAGLAIQKGYFPEISIYHNDKIYTFNFKN